MSKVRKPTKRVGQSELDRAYIFDCVCMILSGLYGAFMAWLIMTM